MLVHVLTPGFTTPNGRAFLFPLVVHRDAIADRGVRLRLFTQTAPDLCDCDVLIVDSKFHRDRWAADGERVVEEFSDFKERVGRLLYFDTTDSTGTLQSSVLPLVDGYRKSQLLKDRHRYLEAHYGHRLFTDHYHRTQGVVDARPEWSMPVANPADLDKLALSWNSGLADHSLWGVYRTALYRRLPLPALLRFPDRFVAPSGPRANEMSCRFGVGYGRASVAWQRGAIRERLENRLPTHKVSRRRYFRELEASKLVVSPFGLGEITLKDFEVFLTGGILLKPDMSHMLTWPDLFRAGETMAVHDWDLTDLIGVIDGILEDYGRARDLAENGQALYRRHICGPEAAELFCTHFLHIVKPSASTAAA